MASCYYFAFTGWRVNIYDVAARSNNGFITLRVRVNASPWLYIPLSFAMQNKPYKFERIRIFAWYWYSNVSIICRRLSCRLMLRFSARMDASKKMIKMLLCWTAKKSHCWHQKQQLGYHKNSYHTPVIQWNLIWFSRWDITVDAIAEERDCHPYHHHIRTWHSPCRLRSRRVNIDNY